MLHELLECLAGVGDPRAVPKIEHRLIDVLAIAVCAVLAGAESFEDIALYGRSKRAWLSRFLELPNGIPSHDTAQSVLMLIDPEAFEQGFLAWTRRAFVVGDGKHEDEAARHRRSPWTARRCGAPSTAGGAGRRCIWSARSRRGAASCSRSGAWPRRAASLRCCPPCWPGWTSGAR